MHSFKGPFIYCVIHVGGRGRWVVRQIMTQYDLRGGGGPEEAKII